MPKADAPYNFYIEQVSVNNAQEAQYVMLEIPIPGACTVVENDPNFWRFHHDYRELKGDKMYIYVDKLAAGFHMFEVQLLPRYSGRFTLNPVKVELMYFPVKSGSNAVERIIIAEQ